MSPKEIESNSSKGGIAKSSEISIEAKDLYSLTSENLNSSERRISTEDIDKINIKNKPLQMKKNILKKANGVSKNYPGPGMHRSNRNYKWLAITGFVLVLLIVLPPVPIIGFITSIVACILITRTNDRKGNAFAIIGIVIGFFTSIFTLILIGFAGWFSS